MGAEARAALRTILPMRVVTVALLGALALAACADDPEPPAAVRAAEARRAVDRMVTIAARRTPAAMDELCALARDRCGGMSGSVRRVPESAPRRDQRPRVRCSREVGTRDWMVVLEGDDGWGRPYVSQLVLTRAGDDVVPEREPAFWLGFAYAGAKVTGSTAWSAAYHPDPTVIMPLQRTAEVLARARAGCDRVS